MRTAVFHRLMTRLALLAMLLLVLMPTLGRLLSAADSGLMPMCTLSGLQLVKAPFAFDPPAPKSPAGMSVDCAYCPILNAMAALAVCLVLAFAPPLARWLPGRFPASVRIRLLSGSLGSRGPPSLR